MVVLVSPSVWGLSVMMDMSSVTAFEAEAPASDAHICGIYVHYI